MIVKAELCINLIRIKGLNEENRHVKKDKPIYSGNSIMVRPNGPLICKGDAAITLLNTNDELIIKESEFALCRCGQSKNKPFCDGSHKVEKIEMSQSFVDEREEPIEGITEELTIKVKKDAMYIVQGAMTIFSRDGISKTSRTKAALCRCGMSDNKPFCDTKHKTCNFRAE